MAINSDNYDTLHLIIKYVILDIEIYFWLTRFLNNLSYLRSSNVNELKHLLQEFLFLQFYTYGVERAYIYIMLCYI